jgi:hypothetical protein
MDTSNLVSEAQHERFENTAIRQAELKVLKAQIAKEVKSARKWTKGYLDSIEICLEEGRLEEALQYASQLGPIWGQVEMVIEESEFVKDNA